MKMKSISKSLNENKISKLRIRRELFGTDISITDLKVVFIDIEGFNGYTYINKITECKYKESGEVEIIGERNKCFITVESFSKVYNKRNVKVIHNICYSINDKGTTSLTLSTSVDKIIDNLTDITTERKKISSVINISKTKISQLVKNDRVMIIYPSTYNNPIIKVISDFDEGLMSTYIERFWDTENTKFTNYDSEKTVYHEVSHRFPDKVGNFCIPTLFYEGMYRQINTLYELNNKTTSIKYEIQTIVAACKEENGQMYGSLVKDNKQVRFMREDKITGTMCITSRAYVFDPNYKKDAENPYVTLYTTVSKEDFSILDYTYTSPLGIFSILFKNPINPDDLYNETIKASNVVSMSINYNELRKDNCIDIYTPFGNIKTIQFDDDIDILTY